MRLSLLYKTTLDALVKSYVGNESTGENTRFVNTLTVDEKGGIVLPQDILSSFKIKPGDTIVALCDSRQGIALVKCDNEAEKKYEQHN